ncbi:MAG: PHP domain-containing protein [Moorellales bacterium]
MNCDLHVHTRASDGALTPEEVIRRAREAGLEAVAVTDHDTTAGLEEALEAGRRLGVLVVPGIEISTEWQEEEVHLLGYWLDFRQNWLQERLTRRREGRLRRAEKIVRRLGELGLDVSWQRVLDLAGGAAVGRPHIALALVEKGYAPSLEEAFRRYLNRGAPAYIPRTPLSPAEAVAIIRRAGGAPVLAHPGLLKKREMLSELLELDLAGLEVYYPAHDASTVAWLEKVAQQRQLIGTGGSDFHGHPGGGYAELGACRVSCKVVEALQAKARAGRGEVTMDEGLRPMAAERG